MPPLWVALTDPSLCMLPLGSPPPRPSVPLTASNGSLDHPPPAFSPAGFWLNSNNMAPSSSSNTSGLGRVDIRRPDRKIRKPLVEKKRRARINESLQELRALIAEAELQSKIENAEVLEMTVQRVEGILRSRAQEMGAADREARERFAAGYIQCMHDVHTFLSSCPGIDPAVAAELLKHLLDSMPLNDEDCLRWVLPDHSIWSLPESIPSALGSPAPSTTSSDELCSDLDETDSEQSRVSSSEEAEGQDALPCLTCSKALWRPW